MRSTLFPALLALFLAQPLSGQTVPAPTSYLGEYRVLSEREQAPIVSRWITKRFDTILPELMRREGIDMWIIISREFNDDPVFHSMAPLSAWSSRRRTMLVFHDRGGDAGVERLSVGRFDYGGLYDFYPTGNDEQFEGLRKIVEERNPSVIGINTSKRWNHADGLTATQRDTLMSTLGPDYGPRVVSAELLAVGWLEAKLPEETEMYRHAMRISHQIIGEAFSNKVIVPGVTTTQDVVWYMRQRVAELGLGGGHRWFHPTVSVQRKGGVPATGPSTGAVRREAEGVVIERGDLLHTDFGFMYMGFATDTQHKAYVLRHGEDEAPAGLREGLRQANRLQDLTLEHARVGRTGNEALRDALAAARAEGLNPMIYSHPIGYHGHGAGPPIGMTDYQDGVPVQGEYPFYANTWHSIELAVRTPVPEWDGEEVRFALEEEAALLEDGWSWIAGQQTEFYLIR